MVGMPRSVVATSWLLLALLAAHDLTHALDDGLRTGLGELAAVAAPQWVVLAVVMAVILRADRLRAATAAFLLGLGTVVGVVGVHLTSISPAPYADLEPAAASWFFALAPVVVGAALVALAVRELGGRRLRARA